MGDSAIIENLREQLRLRDKELEETKANWRDKIEKTVNSTATSVSKLATELKPVSEYVCRHNTILTGDDEPEKGLSYRVGTVEGKVKEHEESHKEARKWWAGIAAGVMVTVVKYWWDVLIKGK